MPKAPAPARKRTRKSKSSTPPKESPEKKPTQSQVDELVAERDVLYDTVEVSVCDETSRLTADQARELLGWTVPKEGDAKFKNAHLIDRQGKTAFCSNTVAFQRDFFAAIYNPLMWDILQGNWEFNGENCIIGRTGLVLDGKHRLTALVLAAQEYERNPERYPHWDDLPEIDTIVVFGIKENLKLVNTIGTGKPRSLADSLFGSGMFGRRSAAETRKVCKMLEFAVRMLWHRTGAKHDAYNPRASHADALDFIQRHSLVIDCVQHVFEENAGKDKKIERLLSGGYCSGLMYLMGCSGTDMEKSKYRETPSPSEDQLDIERMEMAQEYWTLLANSHKNVAPVVEAIGKLAEVGNMSKAERVAIIIKGWNAYAAKQKVTPKQVELKYELDGEGTRQLMEDPAIDGIDMGEKQ